MSRALLELLCAIVILLCLWWSLSDLWFTERWSFDANILFEYIDKYSFYYRLDQLFEPNDCLSYIVGAHSCARSST